MDQTTNPGVEPNIDAMLERINGIASGALSADTPIQSPIAQQQPSPAEMLPPQQQPPAAPVLRQSLDSRPMAPPVQNAAQQNAAQQNAPQQNAPQQSKPQEETPSGDANTFVPAEPKNFQEAGISPASVE